MTTGGEAQATGEANRLIENDLSSVKIAHNSKGTTWEIKVKNENAWRASDVAQKIDMELRKRYEK
jgi:hypothetical protein